MDFLQQRLPPILIGDTGSSDNITVTVWKDFTLDTILRRYENILYGKSLRAESVISSHERIGSDNSLTNIFQHLIKGRLQSALDAGFQHLKTSHRMKGLSVLGFGTDKSAGYYDGPVLDAAFYVRDPYWNRAPGKYIRYWKWESPLRYYILSEINDCMKIHRTRYGFLLTDLGMIAIRRRDSEGNLELTKPVPWNPDYEPGKPQLTVYWHSATLGCWLRMMRARTSG